MENVDGPVALKEIVKVINKESSISLKDSMLR